jgi:hypothetical protein
MRCFVLCSGYIFFSGTAYDYATDITISVFLIVIILGFIGIFVVQTFRIIRAWLKRFREERKQNEEFRRRQAEEDARLKAEADKLEAKKKARKAQGLGKMGDSEHVVIDGEDDDTEPVVVAPKPKAPKSPRAVAAPAKSADDANDNLKPLTLAVTPASPSATDSKADGAAAPSTPAPESPLPPVSPAAAGVELAPLVTAQPDAGAGASTNLPSPRFDGGDAPPPPPPAAADSDSDDEQRKKVKRAFAVPLHRSNLTWSVVLLWCAGRSSPSRQCCGAAQCGLTCTYHFPCTHLLRCRSERQRLRRRTPKGESPPPALTAFSSICADYRCLDCW